MYRSMILWTLLIFTRTLGDFYRRRFRSVVVPLVMSLIFYSLTCLTYCFELYRPNYYLQSSFNFIFLNPLSTFPAVGYRWRKKKVTSAENPALPTVLSLFREDIPSVDSICFILRACQVGVSLPGSCLRIVFAVMRMTSVGQGETDTLVK